MIINVFSYKKAVESLYLGDCFLKNWISIRDAGYEHVYKDIEIGTTNILKLYVDDVTVYSVKHDLIHPIYKEIKEKRDFNYFSHNDANTIINFCNTIDQDNEVLNIHCWAGRSRSQAIGYVLNIYYNLYLNRNLEHFNRNIQKNNFKFMGNPDIIKIMNEVCFKENE
jgi:predicted protein tyrosine phosphatase